MPNLNINRRIILSKIETGVVTDPDAEAFFVKAAALGKPVDDTNKTRITNTYLALKASGQYSNFASLFVMAVGTNDAEGRIWSSIDWITPSRLLTYNNPYSGDFTAKLGYNGNNTDFSIYTNFNPGDGGTYPFTQNSESYGFLNLLDLSLAGNPYEVSCFLTGFGTGGGLFCKTLTATVPVLTIQVHGDTTSPLTTFENGLISTSFWYQATRDSATTYHQYINGVKITNATDNSTAIENKMIGLLGAYDGSFLGVSQFFSGNQMGCFYAGNKDIDQNKLMTALNVNLFTLQGTAAAKDKRIIFEGDSRTGSLAFPALGNNYAYPRRVFTNLSGAANGWGVTAISQASETLASMDSTYTAQIHPYRNTSLTKDIVVIWAATNDIEGGATAVQVYNSIVSFCTKAKADGYKVILVSEIDRNWSSYVAMNAVRAAYNALLLLDFTTPAATNIYQPNNGITYADYVINLIAEVNFQSFLSAYYQGDGIHPSTTGSNKVGDYVSTAIGLLP